YVGADDDARAVDTRTGTPGPTGALIDRALRARFRDEDLKRQIVQWLVNGMPRGPLADGIAEAAAEFESRARGTQALSARFVRRGPVAFVDAGGSTLPYDKTDLLLAGQGLAEVAMVKDTGQLTIAAAFDSGWDFVAELGLTGGMPTRVTVPES